MLTGKPATPGFGQPSAFGQQSNMFGTTQPSGLFGGNQAPAFGSTAPTQQSGFGGVFENFKNKISFCINIYEFIFSIRSTTTSQQHVVWLIASAK